jgi:hypothetical protein
MSSSLAVTLCLRTILLTGSIDFSFRQQLESWILYNAISAGCAVVVRVDCSNAHDVPRIVQQRQRPDRHMIQSCSRTPGLRVLFKDARTPSPVQGLARTRTPVQGSTSSTSRAATLLATTGHAAIPRKRPRRHQHSSACVAWPACGEEARTPVPGLRVLFKGPLLTALRQCPHPGRQRLGTS